MTEEHTYNDAADGIVPPADSIQPDRSEPVEQPTTSPPSPPAPEQKKMSGKKKAVLGVFGLLLLLAVAAAFTLQVEFGDPTPGSTYPYTVTYNVWFPDGEPVTVGNVKMMVLSYGDELILDVNGNREKIVVGQESEVAEHHAGMKIFGVTLLSTDFKMLMKYQGLVEGKANFFLTVKTSRQIPEFIINLLLPREIQAQPM
ncbi:hypothetical protein RJ40_07285 [Methanofollis aquaemaris]|uniref:Uncharacterized protein n=1 Tax=Methanofollis aquaemaris TaxID=126734 RepID=A0A8A3S6T5_9EURY|nr:hypothetical protein [Methanofollis aquaemaris]QSZ67316.1 hypothetical protein RJ40_07285 [Methanofollis aquaemaris]